MALLKLNRRQYFIDVDTIKVEKVSNGRWKVVYDENKEFIVVGGRQSGGAFNEWFCHHPLLYGDQWVPTNSMIAAIKMGAMY